LSPVSIWETLTLAEKGRVALDDAPVPWMKRTLRAAPLREAPLTAEVAYATALLNLPHRDPADRFLAATAYAYGLTLVTADRNLSSLKDIEVLVNR
jgi:PIN domain nuclease of toxin-antitoxin system